MSIFSKTGQWTHTLILYTDSHTHTHMWCEQSSSSMEARIQPAGWTAPPTWRHVSFVVYAFISLLSWTLWTQSLPPFPPSRPVLQPYTYPLPAKAGKYSMALTRKEKRRRGRQKHREETDLEREKKELRCLSHFFFSSFSSSIAPRVSSCSACKSFSCMAGRPLLAAVQLLTLLSPCEREREREREGGEDKYSHS